MVKISNPRSIFNSIYNLQTNIETKIHLQ